MKLIPILTLCLMLSGCAGNGMLDMGKTPITSETITSVTGNITDASAQKEALFFDAVKHRDSAYKSMYAQSGFNVEFEMKEIQPGIYVQLMKKVSFKETPRFEQKLPDGPSEHPFWKFATAFSTKALDTVVWWTGIKSFFDYSQTVAKTPHNTYENSYNQTAEPYIVRPEIVSPEVILTK